MYVLSVITLCKAYRGTHRMFFLDHFLMLSLNVCTCAHCIESVKQKSCMATSFLLPLLSVSHSLVKGIAVAFSGQINEARGSRMTKE